jgi:hypothetical protein
VVRAEPSRDGFGALLRGRMERRGVRARFYSPKAVPRKEGEDLEGKFRSVKQWKEIGRRRGKEEDVVWHVGSIVSETRDGPTRQ